MTNKLKWLNPQNLFLAGYTLALLGMVFSRAGLSIGMVLIIVASLLHNDRRNRLVNYCTNPIVISFFVLPLALDNHIPFPSLTLTCQEQIGIVCKNNFIESSLTN